jgi:sensor histidine kinase YesM
MIELRITKRDWLFIVAIGTFMGAINGYIIYPLLSFPALDGAIFGAITGFYIAGFSSFLITFLNSEILPNISTKYWYPSAFFFSFISGFFGSSFAFYTFAKLNFMLIPLYQTHLLEISISMGLLTYLIGLILYFLITVRTEKDRLNSLLIESRLKSLEEQLNPHFIFNSLNSVLELIYIDKELAETTILKLSRFLRDGMKESSRIELFEEIMIVKNYVWIENVRFSGRIELNLDIDSRLYQMLIPKFSIQLLVENAIKHSFRRYRGKEKFQISVSASEDSTGLRIYVSNSGDEIIDLQFGIGLSNLKSRVEILNRGKVEYQYVNNQITFQIYLKELYENISS